MIRFRATKPEDILTISDWITRDKGHKGMAADFFAHSEPGISAYAIEDERGAVMYVRQESHGEDTILHVQFAPFHRKRIVAVLRQGYPLVAEDARCRGFKRVRFDSKSPALIRTMIEMGFKAELVADL